MNKVYTVIWKAKDGENQRAVWQRREEAEGLKKFLEDSGVKNVEVYVSPPRQQEGRITTAGA